MPNCKVPVTVKIIMCMLKTCDGNHVDSLDSVMHDWNVLCFLCGFHLYEWEQNASDKKNPQKCSHPASSVHFPRLNLYRIRLAYNYPIIVFGTLPRQRWLRPVLMASPENLNNAETIIHGRCLEPRVYPVLSFLRTQKRAFRLVNTCHFPVAVFTSFKRKRTRQQQVHRSSPACYCKNSTWVH